MDVKWTAEEIIDLINQHLGDTITVEQILAILPQESE